MPHFPKPFFRRSRKLWYVQLDGQQHNLGPDKEAAFAAYHELMRKPREKRRARSDSIAQLIDLFLDYTQKNSAHDTYEWYRTRLQQFLDRYPDLTIQELRPFHVQKWIDSNPKWSSGTKRNFCRSIIRIQIRMGLRKGVDITKAEVIQFASTLKQTKTVKGMPFQPMEIVA